MGVCDDLISRQDAINLLKEWSDGYSYIEVETESAIKDFQHLPSAQQWIPVTERLPEKYIGQWLCCTSDGDIMVLPYDTPGDGTKECVFYQWDDDGYFYQTFDVIAWMPLPEPYNEELKLR